MTAPTMTTAELLPAAWRLAEERGELPAASRLKKTLKIGWPKAKALHEMLRAEVLRRTSRRGRIRAGATEAPRPARRTVVKKIDQDTQRMIRETSPVSGVPVSPGMPPLDPWDYSRPLPLVDLAEYPPVPAEEQIREAGCLREDRPGGGLSEPDEGVPPQARRSARWPLLLLALPAFVAIWSGWVALGGMTGFGVIHPLPGIADDLSLNTAITLPIGLETYAAYALYVWISGRATSREARRFAGGSGVGSLLLGGAGQVAYHLMAAAGMTSAPWWITTIVACLPVAVLGMGAALYHLVGRPAAPASSAV